MEPLEIAPREARIHQLGHQRRGNRTELTERRGVDLQSVLGQQLETGTEVPFAPAQDRQVDCQHDGGESGLARLVEDSLGQAAIRMPVELEPASPRSCCFGDIRWTRGCKGREAHDRPCGRGRARDGHLSVRMGHPLIGHGRRDDRHRELCSEDGCDRRHLADIDQHARPEAPVIECLDVASDRVFVACASGEVAKRGLVQSLLGDPFVVPDIEWGLLRLHARSVFKVPP
jgi:hypothetical protein